MAAIGCDGGDDESPSPTPSAVESSTPAPDATETPVAGVTELTFGEPAQLPLDTTLVIETGCWQCDGPTTSLVRLRRGAGGIEERTLFDATSLPGTVTGYAFDGVGGRVAVSVCAPHCLGMVERGQQTTLYLSADGGASFSASEPIDGWYSVDGYDGDTILMGGPVAEPTGAYPVVTYPGLAEARRPEGGVHPEPITSTIFWTTGERNTLLASDGTVVFASAGDEIIRVTALDESAGRVAILLFRFEDGTGTYRLSIGRREGSRLEHERTLAGDGFIHAGALIDECTLVANTEIPLDAIPTPGLDGAAFVGLLPALIDICEGVVLPIVDPFTRQPYLNGRNLIVAVRTD
jgi:hypothetical protein